MIKLTTKHPLAEDSPDHLMPHGTRQDNHVNQHFNDKLYQLYPDKILRALDLGCAGGGFVKSVIDDGHIAVGLEGSDWSKKMRRAAWPVIPNSLFTCDITKPLQLKENGKPMKFDVITAFEVLEHIKKEDLRQLFLNVARHLSKGGLLIATINLYPEVIDGHVLHQTIESKHWWETKLFSSGFLHHKDGLAFFNGHLLRNSSRSFHAVCSFGGLYPEIPERNWKQKLWDNWLESRPQKFIKRLLQ